MGLIKMDLKEEQELRKELSNAGASEEAIDKEIARLKQTEKEREMM